MTDADRAREVLADACTRHNFIEQATLIRERREEAGDGTAVIFDAMLAFARDGLASFEKFDGVGPHAETIETRARVGERYLECYESALTDPRLAGYSPADCPSELLLDILGGGIAAFASPPMVAESGEVQFQPLASAERKFVNSVGNSIEIYAATGAAQDRLCRLSMYGPDSGIDSYMVWDEMVQMHSALGEVLALRALPASQAREGELSERAYRAAYAPLRSAQHALDLIARPHSTIRASKQLAAEESVRIEQALAALTPSPVVGEGK